MRRKVLLEKRNKIAVVNAVVCLLDLEWSKSRSNDESWVLLQSEWMALDDFNNRVQQKDAEKLWTALQGF